MTQKTKNKTRVATIGFVAIAVIMTSSIIAFDPTLLDVQAAKENPGFEAKTHGGPVPVGTVLDWFCTDPCTIPNGYALADGSTVTDPGSPLLGETLPDLSDKFVRGTTDASDVGDSAGVDSHTHDVDPINTATTTEADHTHDVDPASISSGFNGGHSHNGGTFGTFGTNSVTNCTFAGGCTSVADDSHNHNVSHSSVSSHTHVVNIPTTTSTAEGEHNHDVNIASTTSTAEGEHNHNVNIASTTSSSESNVPGYVYLLKIVRIK